MRKKLTFPVLLSCLILVLSGCLPSMPKKILGPTWTSQYRIPLIREKKINLGSKDGMGLENTSINCYKIDAEPTTFKLYEKRATVNPGTIEGLELRPISEIPGIPKFTAPIEPANRTLNLGEDLNLKNYGEKDRIILSFSPDHNYIELTLINAKAGEVTIPLIPGKTDDFAGEYKGLTFHLYRGEKRDSVLEEVTIPSGGNSVRFNLAERTISPVDELTIEVSGAIEFVPGGNPGIEFSLAPLEIEGFEVDSFDAITKDLKLDALEIDSVKLRDDDADLFELKLKEANLSLFPVLPENLKITTDLTIEAMDRLGNPIASVDWPITLETHKTFDFSEFKGTPKDFKDAFNNILKDGTHSLKISLGKIEPDKADQSKPVKITYPGESSLKHELTLALECLTYGSSFEGPDGSIDLEDSPVGINEANLFFEVENNSPVGLKLEIWLSPNSINKNDPDADPKAYKTELTITAGKKDTFAISYDPDNFSELIKAKKIYHLIKFHNNTGTDDLIQANDHLAVTAWAEVKCTINKR